MTNRPTPGYTQADDVRFINLAQGDRERCTTELIAAIRLLDQKVDRLQATLSAIQAGASRPTAPANEPPPVDCRFDEFWEAYPNTAGKKNAREKFASACKRADPQLIIDAARRYASDPNRDPTYTAHATTWLDGDRWEDPPLPARAKTLPAAERNRAAAQSLMGRRPWELPEEASNPTGWTTEGARELER